MPAQVENKQKDNLSAYEGDKILKCCMYKAFDALSKHPLTY